MKTVLIVPAMEHKSLERWEIPDETDENIDYMTSNLTAFLQAVL
jgi:putative hydrolase of the HAD superfamily